MPLRRKLQFEHSPRADALRSRLIEEWRNPRDDIAEPIIIEHDKRQGDSTHLYVIWGDWNGLDQQERSEIIMDAYVEVRGDEKAMFVTVAMGLTPDEADRMRINYKDA